MFIALCFEQDRDCIRVFTESTGNIAQCSATPANAPAVHDTRRGVDGGRLSYSSITDVLFDHKVN